MFSEVNEEEWGRSVGVSCGSILEDYAVGYLPKNQVLRFQWIRVVSTA